MTLWPKLAIALLPGGTLALAAVSLFRCRHRHEVLSQLRAEKPTMGLRCTACLRTRPHPWAQEPARYHRTQEALPEPLTGIEREAQRQAAEKRAVSETLTLVEWQTRRREISERAKAWKEGR